MIVFVIPLKSKQVSKSWHRVCQLLDRCLQSIVNQRDPDYRVIVIHHDRPDLQVEDPKINFVPADFDGPSPTDIEAKRNDKAKKSLIGLQYAARFSPDFAMFVDADDCLSNRIAGLVNQNLDANGWFLNSGYVYQEGSPFIYYRKSHFHHWCGTCNILRYEQLPLPPTAGSYPSELLDCYGGAKHRDLEKTARKQGKPLEPLPFPGAVYIIGNGENIYQTGFGSVHNSNRGKPLFMLKELLKFRPLGPWVRREFNLTKLAIADDRDRTLVATPGGT